MGDLCFAERDQRRAQIQPIAVSAGFGYHSFDCGQLNIGIRQAAPRINAVLGRLDGIGLVRV